MSSVRPAVAAAGTGRPLEGSSSQPPPQQQELPPYALWPATARVALRTGVYIAVLGLALFLLPASVFGAVFDARWVQPGGSAGRLPRAPPARSCQASASLSPGS